MWPDAAEPRPRPRLSAEAAEPAPEAEAAPGAEAEATRRAPARRVLAAPMEDLLAFLARGLVDDPDEVVVDSFEEDDGTIVLELSVADGRRRQGDRPRRPHHRRAADRGEGLVGAREPARAGRRRRSPVAPVAARPRSGAPTASTAASTSARPPTRSPRARVVTVGGTERRVERRAGTDAAPVVRLEGVGDRDAAAALTGELLAVAARAAPLGEDEWLAARPGRLRGGRASGSGDRGSSPGPSLRRARARRRHAGAPRRRRDQVDRRRARAGSRSTGDFLGLS